MDPNSGKKQLFNKLGREDLIQRLENEVFQRKTVSFYKYVIIAEPAEMRDTLYSMWNKLNCLGRIYIAREGINAQMNVPEQNWEMFEQELRNIPEFEIPG